MTDAQEQPKRRLPRFSLITLIVAVNVAGVLVWANVRPVSERRSESKHGLHIEYYQGWMFTACEVNRGNEVTEGAYIYRYWYMSGALANALLAFLVLGASVYCTERVRRRSASLITVVVVAGLAGGLLWLNGYRDMKFSNKGTLYEDSVVTQGWPFLAYSEFHNNDVDGIIVRWSPGGLLTNALLILLASGASVYSTEFLVRKFRKANRHDG